MIYYDYYLAAIALAIMFLAAIPMGKYMYRVFTGQPAWLSAIFRPLENGIYRFMKVQPTDEMDWKEYSWSFIGFNLAGFAFLFLLQLCQGILPLNPQKLPGVRWDLAFNTAVSFMTNTNWQSYGGESTLSYLSQMLGLTVQNFVSAASGIAAMVAVSRGFVRKNTLQIGNFWVDLTRSVVYILLPLSIIMSVFLVSQGVVQTFHPYQKAQTLEGKTQVIALGPVATQVAIKQLGSNGGGFFNANSSHPFENPTGASNLVEILAILFLPVALVFTFGHLIQSTRQGWAIFLAMFVLFAAGLLLCIWAESYGNPLLSQLGIQHGLNMEGKEMRVGVPFSVIWGLLTTITSNGSVNAMHDSFLPLVSLVYLFNMGIGEVVFGGVGVGVIGILYFIFLTMFVAGLMIGRTPEFLGKKLGPFEMIMSIIGILAPSIVLLILSAVAIHLPAARNSLNNPGAHGLSEILYAYTSAAANNGSAFAGLNANTVFYNLTLGITMLISRFTSILPALAIAGALSQKKTVPTTIATFPTTGWLFIVMLIGVILIMGALTFFPIYTLGPILDHYSIHPAVVQSIQSIR